LFTGPLAAQPPGQKWVVSWIGSVHGPYPSGNPSARPDMKLAFPSAEAGARDPSFRMIVKPEIRGKEARLRMPNALGTRPVSFDGLYVGLQFGSSAVISGTSRPVTFGGKRSVTIAPGAAAGGVLVVGLLRVFFFEKGAGYYLHSEPFIARSRSSP